MQSSINSLVQCHSISIKSETSMSPDETSMANRLEDRFSTLDVGKTNWVVNKKLLIAVVKIAS